MRGAQTYSMNKDTRAKLKRHIDSLENMVKLAKSRSYDDLKLVLDQFLRYLIHSVLRDC